MSVIVRLDFARSKSRGPQMHARESKQPKSLTG